jgi:hypothetical protein
MTIAFSKSWFHHSWSTNPAVKLDQQAEELLIREMVRNSDSDLVRLFALSESEYGVYVRTGLHSSQTEGRDHVQVVLGSNDPQSWKKSAAETGKTAHIIFHDPRGNPTQRYETHVYDGQPHLRRVGY